MQKINQESNGFEELGAITSEAQNQQNINNDVVDFSLEDDGNRKNQCSSKNKSDKEILAETEDFYSVDQLISIVKKR